jgi:Holliday junction resolvasome RuvABC endonuclease subunit
MGSSGMVFDIGEAGGVLKLMLYEQEYVLDKNLYIIPPTSLKAFLTGKGNAKKPEIQKAILKIYGISFENDNLADAYGLGKMLLELGTELPKLCNKNGYKMYAREKAEKEI